MADIKTRIKNREFDWLIAFGFGVVAMYIMLSYSQLLSTGKYVILAGDALEQNVAFIRMVCRNILNGESPFFSFDYFLGFNTSIPLAWYAMSPINILYLLFSKADVNIITAVILVLKSAAAAAAFQIFAAKVLKAERLPSVLFAVFYSMCGFVAVYGMYHFIWLDAVYLLPVVALGIYYAVEKNNYVILTIAYAVAFISQFYMGYMVGIFSLLLFVLLLIANKEKGKKYILGSVGKYALSLLVSILLSAFIWVPVLVFLLHNRATDSTGFQTLRATIFDIFNNLFFGQFQGSEFAPYIYCGIPTLLLLPFYFLNSRIEKRERIIYGILTGFFVLSCLIQPLYVLMHAFDAPDGYFFRFSFIISFLLCVIACRQSGFLKEMKRKGLVIWCTVLFVIYIAAFIIQRFTIPGGSRNNLINLLINALIIGIWIILGIQFIKNSAKRVFKILLLLIMMLEVIANGAVRTNHPSSSSEFVKDEYYYSWSNNMLATVEALKTLDAENEFYRVSFFDDLMSNSDSFWGYHGVTDFATGENEQLRRFMKNMGLFTLTRSEYPTGLTPTLEMLLGMKYRCRLFTISDVAGLDVQPRVEINDYWLPLGYMVEDTAKNETEFCGNVFENQNAVIRNLSGVDEVFREVPKELTEVEENGLKLVNETDIVKDGDEDMNIIFRAHDIANDVYIQPDVVEPAAGIQYMSSCQNIAKQSDLNISPGYAAKLWKSENENYIMVQAGDVFPGELKTNGIYLYELDEEQFGKAYESLSREVFRVEEYKNGYVKGNVKVEGERRVLFTSIPYAEGWTVRINGKEASLVPLVNGVFMGVELPDCGTYEIEFIYHCPGVKLGVILSLAGLLIASALIAFLVIKKRSGGADTVTDNNKK